MLCLEMLSQKIPEKGICVCYCFWETNIGQYVVWYSFLETKILFWETRILWLCTSFACAKGGRPLRGSSWKLLERTSVSRFLAYVRPLQCHLNENMISKNIRKLQDGPKCIKMTFFTSKQEQSWKSGKSVIIDSHRKKTGDGHFFWMTPQDTLPGYKGMNLV